MYEPDALDPADAETGCSPDTGRRRGRVDRSATADPRSTADRTRDRPDVERDESGGDEMTRADVANGEPDARE